MLERMRDAVKDRMKPKLAKDSFILKPFELCRTGVDGLGEAHIRENAIDTYYKEKVAEFSLSANHFISLKDLYSFNGKLEPKRNEEDEAESENQNPKKPTILEPSLINGYDGLSGAHDNIVWCRKDNQYAYTLNNKLILEQTKSREQILFCETTVRLSCMCLSDDEKFLAVGEGEPGDDGYSKVYYY